MNKHNLWKGLCGALSVTLGLFVGLTSICFEYEGSVNEALNISTGNVSSGSGTGETVYKSNYGELSDANLEKLLADEEKFVAEEMEAGCVLLHNDGALPLDKTGLKVTLFGKASYDPIYKNHSAGGVLDESRQVSLIDALKNIGYSVNETLFNAYANGKAVRDSTDGPAQIGEESIDFYTQNLIDSCADYKDAAIVVIARAGGEGDDLDFVDADGVPQLSLHQAEKDMLNLVKQQGFKKTIVLLNSAYAMDMGWLEEYGVNACLWIGTPGLTGFNGVANLLNGTANPSGRLVDTYATDSMSSPAIQNFGSFFFENQSDLAYVVNAEGIYVGYKYYETRYEDCVMNVGNANATVGSTTGKAWNYADEVVFPFGYGLSYTSFSRELLSCDYDEAADEFTLKVKITNTGDIAGKEVVQVYLQSPYTDYDKANLVEKASIQLVGFAKSKLLNAGESEEVTVTVDRYLCASYDDNAAKGYILDAGAYYFGVGNNCHDALNNVLAKKGYTVANGMTEDGDENLVAEWKVEELDTKSYKYSSQTGQEVTNVFVGDYAIDINDFYDNDVVTYLSRQDWQGTYPKSYTNLTASQALLNATKSDTYVKSATAKSVSDFTMGEEANINFIDLVDWEWDDPRWDTFLNQLTLEELGIVINNNTGTRAIESIAKPANRDADGPDGSAFNYKYGKKGSATCYAGQIVSGSSWDKDILTRRGDFMAEDALYCGVTETFGPGQNLHRTPYSGRNFEYYSEDSILAYYLGAYQCAAMQNKGLIAGPKHFAGNDQETNRNQICTFMTEQRYRQECMKPFEGSFIEGGAMGVMGMMGRVGCKASMVCTPLITTVLRGEWGYKGIVITDAGGMENSYQPTAECILAGVDAFCLTSRSSVLIAEITKNDDGDLLEALRQVNKRFYYTRVRTNMINGLTSETTVSDVTPWWKIAMIAVDSAVALLALGSAAMFVITAYVKKKQ